MSIKKTIALFCFGVVCALHVAAQAPTRVEPAFWWVGMKSPELQLLVHHEGIRDYIPVAEYEGVYLIKSTKTSNPNYLFLNFVIGPQAKPGRFTIQFQKQGKTLLRYTYELLAREEGAAQRQGFNTRDVMYLITPDRFVNGDPRNDNVPSLTEKANRSFKGGRHGGDLAGIRQRLPYIDSMGFTAIWLNPVLENNQPEYSYHGYSTTDFYKVDARFGTNEDYRALSKEAKKRGIKMVMDMIVNHCGTGHWWMADLPMEDWLNFQKEGFTPTSHRRETIQDPYASDYDTRRHADGWFVASMPDLNQRNSLLATYLIQNTIWWIEYADLAGIRMDTYPYPDKDFMSEWTRRVMEEYPNFNIVGEEWSVNPAIVAFWQRGKQNPNGYVSYLPSLMDFPLQHNLSAALNGDEKAFEQGLMKLYSTIASDFLYPSPNDLVVFSDNHDMSRIFTQLNEDFALYKMALTYLLTTRGVPQIYYGTEILMTNPGTDDHGIIRSDMPGGWAGDAVNAFTNKGLTAAQLEAKKFVRDLVHWRKTASAIHHGKMKHFAPFDGVYVYFRYTDEQTFMVVLNKNAEPYTLEKERFAEMLQGKYTATEVFGNTNWSLSLPLSVPARAATIYELK